MCEFNTQGGSTLHYRECNYFVGDIDNCIICSLILAVLDYLCCIVGLIEFYLAR